LDFRDRGVVRSLQTRGGAQLFSSVAFVWASPADARFAIGDVADVGSYNPTSTGSAAFVTSLDVTEVPAPGAGIYFVLRSDCAGSSWSSEGSGQCCTRTLP
jgi:hypothetical protein